MPGGPPIASSPALDRAALLPSPSSSRAGTKRRSAPPASPPPGRRAREREGAAGTPTTLLDSSPLSGSAASTASASSSRELAPVPRRRLSVKTTPGAGDPLQPQPAAAAAPAAAPPQPGGPAGAPLEAGGPAGEPETGGDGWTCWAADGNPLVERQKYWSFRHKLLRWARAAAGADPEPDTPAAACQRALVRRAATNFRATTGAEKSLLVKLFLDASAAPDAVRDWASVRWPEGGIERGARSRWLNSKASLFTYNGDWGIRDRAAFPADATLDDVARQLATEPAAVAMWDAFQAVLARVREYFDGVEWAISQEICPDLWSEQGLVRIHIHMFLALTTGSRMVMESPTLFVFQGCVPHRSCAIGTMVQRSCSSSAGLYYCEAPKVGSLRSAACKRAHSGYSVSPEWIQGLLSTGKMTPAAARREFIASGRGLVRRLGDLDRLVREREALRLEARVAEIQAALSKTQARFKEVAAVTEWFRASTQPFLRRKKFLVLEGASGLGKTEYIRSLAGPSATLELNCAACAHPDLRAHNARLHRVVLFDEAQPVMVASNRKVFQAPAAWVDLGHSPTGRDVYRIFLADSVLVVASNSWNSQLRLLPAPEDRDWLRTNSVHVLVTEPLFEAA